MRYETLRDKVTGDLLDARCEADLKVQPFGGLDTITYAHAVEEIEPEEVRRLLNLPSLPKEFGVVVEEAASNLRAELMSAGLTAEDVKLIAGGKVGVVEMKALLAKAVPAPKVL
jgi:hypothetical protein